MQTEVNQKPVGIPMKCVVCNGFGTVNWGKTTCHACSGYGYILIPTKLEEKKDEENRDRY
ncbi:MAG: hypothetical protein ABH819_03100 [Patescibacteria group bacterium]